MTSSSRNEPLGIEAKLWAAADKLRGNIDASEYKHVVLGLVFLKYVSDSFEGRKAFLEEAVAEEGSEYYIRNPDRRAPFLEDRDLYKVSSGSLRRPAGQSYRPTPSSQTSV